MKEKLQHLLLHSLNALAQSVENFKELLLGGVNKNLVQRQKCKGKAAF